MQIVKAPPVGRRFAQVAWVVPDIEAAARFFQRALGIAGFSRSEISARDVAGTYRGRPADFEIAWYMAWSGDSFLELIQPLSGPSIFQEFLDRNPAGGVQHVAYYVTDDEFDAEVSRLEAKGHPVIQTLSLPVARTAFFDTESTIGVVTEIVGVMDAGYDFMEQLRRGELDS